MRFFRQGYWSRLPFPPPGDLSHPGMELASPVSPTLQADSLPTEPHGISNVACNIKRLEAAEMSVIRRLLGNYELSNRGAPCGAYNKADFGVLTLGVIHKQGG